MPTKSAIPAASPTRWAITERSRAWCSTPRQRSIYALLALALGIVAATLLRPPPTAGPAGRDFEAYYAAGATAAAGGDPWSRDIWRVERTIAGVDATRDELLPYAGPAAALPLFEALAYLPFETARDLWLAGLLVALAALAWAAVTLTGCSSGALDAGVALLFAALSGPAISALGLGQAALVAAAALTLAVLALQRRSPWALPAAFIAGIQPNLALPLAACLWTRRAALTLAAAAATFLALTLALGGGPAGVAAYVQRLVAHGGAERFTAIQYGVPAIAAALGASHGAASAIGAGIALLAFTAVALAAVRMRAQPVLASAVAVALLPWIVPFFHEHDFVLDLFPAIVLAAAPQARVRALAGIAAALALVDWFGAAQRPAGAAQTAILALALGCAYAALPGPAGGRAPFAALAAGAAIALGALPLAHAFPAHVWPDALGAFHAPAGLDASAVWAAEQRRSGLDAAVPAWGLLRALPLAGGLLFALAAAFAAREERVSPAAPPR